MKKQRKYSKNFIVGAIITGLMMVLLVWGLIGTPYDPDAMDASLKFAPVSFKHLMGCDNFGRDIFSRVLVGLGSTLLVAAGTVLIGTVIGTIIGAVTGYFGGVIDQVLMRVIDTMFAFPSILLAMVIVSVMGRGTYQLILALGIGFVPSYARIVRGEFLKAKNADYVRAAKLYGASHLRIIFVHILPNIRQVLLSSIMIGFNNAVLAEAGMSYLGIGVQPPTATLGKMLSEAQTYLFSKPDYVLFPGIVLVLLILGFSLLGEGLKRGK